MYLVVIGWLYVVVVMSVAEASNSTGTILGAIVTFFLYGLLPLALVVYLMRTPQRRKANKARELLEDTARLQAQSLPVQPNAGGHAPGAAEPGGISPVREKK